MQVRSAIQAAVFRQEVACTAGLCVGLSGLFHVNSSVGRSSDVRIRTRLRTMLHRSPQRKRQNDPLRHCPHFVLFNTVDSNYIQLHKSRGDDPTAQYNNVCQHWGTEYSVEKTSEMWKEHQHQYSWNQTQQVSLRSCFRLHDLLGAILDHRCFVALSSRG